MKTTVLAQAAVYFFAITMCCGCAADSKTLTASEKMISEKLEFKNFSAVNSHGQTTVEVKTGSDYSVTCIVPENMKDYFDIKNVKNTLSVTNNNKYSNCNIKYKKSKERAKVIVTLPRLATVVTSGQSSMTVIGNVANSFSANTSGQSELQFNNDISATTIGLVSSGQSSIQLDNISAQGKVTMNASGQSDINVITVTTSGVATLTTSGQADIKGSKLTAGSTVANASGQSDIKFKRCPGQFRSHTSGQADISLNKK